jgi:1,4-dihydroxy-2-naphthoyl-CoA synthase
LGVDHFPEINHLGGTREATEAGFQALRETYKTGEPREGMNAFLEKRKPNYQDKF